MRMMLATCVCASLILAGCSFKRPRLPRVHKLTVQQGNVINQKMIDKLKPGMTRNQVAFVMGEPVVRNSFNDDRWDYVYTIELPGVYSTTQTVTLFFVDEQLAALEALGEDGFVDLTLDVVEARPETSRVDPRRPVGSGRV